MDGQDGCQVKFAKCCNPLPGDEIIGFVTRGRGVTVHRKDCVNVENLPPMDRERLIEAHWQEEESENGGLYMTNIKIFATNRTGLLVDITRIFTERKIDVAMVNSRTSKHGMATIEIEFETRGKEELRFLVDKIRQVESVLDIERSSG